MQFTGVIKNEMRAEPGVNITLKGLEEERIILAPSGPWHNFEKKHDSNTINLTFAPSSGTTEGLALNIEITNGTEKTTTQSKMWEVELTGTSDTENVEVNISIVYDYGDEEEEEEE